MDVKTSAVLQNGESDHTLTPEKWLHLLFDEAEEKVRQFEQEKAERARLVRIADAVACFQGTGMYR